MFETRFIGQVAIGCAVSFVSHAQAIAAVPAPAPVLATSTAVDDKTSALLDTSGSPSSANGTVSAATVEDAMSRVMPRSSPFNISLGSSIAEGKFGSTSRTSIWATALSARYTIGALRLSASLPYMRIRGRGTVFSGIDSTPIILSPTGVGSRQTHSGLGDLTIGGAYTIETANDGYEVELAGRVKLPTASDASKLSSGKTDYSAGVQVTRSMGSIAPFVSVSYRAFGDPAGLRIRDGLAASAGSSFVVGDRAVLLASYHYARSASTLVRDSHELFAGGSVVMPGDKLRLTGFATAGPSDGAAGVSGGVSASLDF